MSQALHQMRGNISQGFNLRAFVKRVEIRPVRNIEIKNFKQLNRLKRREILQRISESCSKALEEKLFEEASRSKYDVFKAYIVFKNRT